MAVNRTCYSWTLHPEIRDGEQVQGRHRCRGKRGHVGDHDCGRLECWAFRWRNWRPSAMALLIARKTAQVVIDEQSRRALG